jgi:uncharacterized protein
MKLQTNTITAQRALGKYTRTGKSKPKSSIDENIDQYRRLVFNNVMDIIESTFPLAYKLVGSYKWTKLVKEYFAVYTCTSPLFWQMPNEFLDYVKLNSTELQIQFPQLINLMDMEWMEIEVFMMPDELISPFTIEGDMNQDKLIVNPELKILPLNYPVFSKKSNKINASDFSQYFISIHRNHTDKNVSINELGLIQVEILLYLHEHSNTLNDVFQFIKSNTNYKNYTLKELTPFIRFCMDCEIILGYQKH